MEGDLPFSLAVFDGDLTPRGPIAAPNKLDGAVRRNLPGAATFTLDDDHPRIDALTTPGAQCLLQYRHSPDVPRMDVLSGPVVEVAGKGGIERTRTFIVLDDWATVFNDIVGLPNPTGSMQQQGDDGAYFTRTGPAETVLTDIVGPNAERQGVDLTIPPSAGRGTNISVSIRMHPLADRLFPAVTQAGLLVRVINRGAGRVLEVREPVTYPHELTEESEVVSSEAGFKIVAPTVTRVLIGAGGEGEARFFAEYIDHAREALWHCSRARFIDARDVKVDDPNRDTILATRAAAALAEGGAKSSMKVELAETDTFRWGRTVNVGDFAPIRLTGAPPITEAVTEVEFSWDIDSGRKITPRVGEWQDSPADDLYRLVADTMRAQRALEVR
jgi:hypothetical protein